MASPQQLTNRLNEAIAHQNARRLDRAEAIYRQIAPVAQRMPIVFHLWGQLCEQQGRLEDALRCYARACQIDGSAVASAIRLASVLIALGRVERAEAALRRVTERVPKSPEAWNVLGFVLKVRGRLADALACHQRAVELNPGYVDGWCHLGLTLGVAGKNHAAVRQYDRALALDPKCRDARFGRAQALHKVYRTGEAIAEYDIVLRDQPHHLEARSYRLFALQNVDTVTREQLFAEHCTYGRLAGAGPDVLPGYDLSPERRLRVAMLSPDFRTHSCAYFIEPLIRGLDPAQFELFLYHDHFVEDVVTARFRNHAATWRNFVGQPHEVVERLIRDDRPDILVDLTGHIGNSIRLPLFARRLAPVQITYLGYPDTTGVAAMDYRFTDPVADPPGEADRFATEQLVRFSSTAWCYQPAADAPDVEPPPCTTGEPVTFGCFNSPTKFTDSLFKAWAGLLKTVPDSRLLLKGRDFDEAPVREHVMARMAGCGIAMERVELLPRTAGLAEHLKQYGRMDVALDTFPYNGTTTTCEALWMGRPVVTIAGDRHAGRVGSSLLTAVGRSEWIARDVDEYIRVAATLALNQAALRDHAAGLRPDMRRSELLSEPIQSARFAQALRECWRAKGAASAARGRVPA